MDLIFHFSLISTAVSYVVVVVNSLSKSLVKNNRRSQVYFKMSTFLFLCAVLSCFSPVWLCDLRTVAHQAPLSTGFSCLWTEAYLPLDILEWVAMPSLGDLPNPGIEPISPGSSPFAGRFFTHWATWEALFSPCCCCCSVAQSCLTLCNPMDCSLPGSSIHGIFQARVLEWVAVAFSSSP